MPDSQPSNSPISKKPQSAGKPPCEEGKHLPEHWLQLDPTNPAALNKGKKWLGPYLEPYFENVAVGVLLIAILFPVGYFILRLL